MTTALGRSPLQMGRAYRDRRGRIWRITRVTNAGTAFLASLPSMALAVCLEETAALDVDTKHAQWVHAADGRWSSNYETDLDLVASV